jgi:hypothetical protein
MSKAARCSHAAGHGTTPSRSWKTLAELRDATPCCKFDDKWIDAQRRRNRPASHLGHLPDMVHRHHGQCPVPIPEIADHKRGAIAARKALEYMGLGEPAYRSNADSRSTRSSSAPAPTAASKICAPPPRSLKGYKIAPNVKLAMVVPGSAAGQSPGRARRARQNLQGGRL